MLLIGLANVKKLREFLENYDEGGRKFEVVKQEGLNLTVKHNLEDDPTAKALVKKLVKSNPALASYFLSVKIVDEEGNLIL